MALKGMNKKARSGMHYGNTRIEFDSNKNRCRIVAESLLEYIEFMRLEYEPEVVSYTPHPGVITIADESENIHKSIFDAEIHMADGSTVLEEIKYSKELKDENSRSSRQVRLQEEWCRKEGYEYRIVTEKEIAKNPVFLNNCLFICQRLRPERIEDERMLKVRAASLYKRIKDAGGRAVIGELLYDIHDAEDAESTITAVCVLLKDGLISADIENKNIFLGSEVWVNGQKEV